MAMMKRRPSDSLLMEPIKAPWQSDASAQGTVLAAQRLTRIRGRDIIRDPYLNKGTAFSERERELLGLKGLLPTGIFTIEEQLVRQKKNFDKQSSNIAKYVFLEAMHDRNETLYYRFILENLEATMPIVYTPTVGQACLEFSENYRSWTRGLYLNKYDKDCFKQVIGNWPQHEVDIIVVTDGSRILGLGDLGINGAGIPIGKLALYVAAAGFKPWRTLPITIDMGTNNMKYRESDDYIGLREERPGDVEFYDIMGKAMDAILYRWPSALIQFEDFSTEHAFGLLEMYRKRTVSFNDDIQGTASTVLAGLLGALRIQSKDGKRTSLREQKICFLGAGSAGAGVADLICQGMAVESKEAGENKPADWFRKNQLWMVDSKGVVSKARGDKLQAHKVPFAREDGCMLPDLLSVVKEVQPDMLIGLAGQGPQFTEEIISLMTASQLAKGKRPVIMALSNPTSKAEINAENCYAWSEGEAIFASGSPFPPVERAGKTHITGQGNNMYVFPGIGYGAVIAQASEVTDSMLVEAARRLSLEVSEEDLAMGSVYPKIKDIRSITTKVAYGVCKVAEKEGLNALPPPEEGWLQKLKDGMWWPMYEEYV